MVDYSNQNLRQAWADYVPRRAKRRSPLPFLFIALAALVVCGAAVATAWPESNVRITVSAAYLEHNGERIRRPERYFSGIDPSESATFARLIEDYKEISRALVRIAGDLDYNRTLPAAATALIRNREAGAVAALVTLSTLSDGELKDTYTGYYLYAQYRLVRLSEAPCGESVWQAAKDLWIIRN